MLLLFARVAQAERDWQMWFDQVVTKGLTEKVSLRGAQSLRYSFDTHELATYFLEAGGTYHLRPWLDGGLSYRQQYDRRDGHWVEENRPYVDGTLRWKTKRLTLSDRNRLEYRCREGQRDTFRYRNKLMLQCNGWGYGFGLKPYVAAEGFVDGSGNLKERDQARFTVGVRTEPSWGFLRAALARWGHAVTVDYYVTEQRKKASGAWTSEYIAGVQLGVAF